MPYLRPKWPKALVMTKTAKTIPFRAEEIFIAHIREYPLQMV